MGGSVAFTQLMPTRDERRERLDLESSFSQRGSPEVQTSISSDGANMLLTDE